MTETENVEAHVPITITIDVESLLKSELGWTTYNAGSHTDPEPGYAPGGNGRIIDVVAIKLAASIQDEVKATARDAVRDKVLEKVDGLIDDVMDGTIQLTSQYGEPKAPETTLREAMIKAMTDRLDQKVDKDGKRAGDSYGSRGDRTYLQWRAEKTANDVMDKELSAKLSDAAKRIKEQATDIVGKKIAEVLGRGF